MNAFVSYLWLPAFLNLALTAYLIFATAKYPVYMRLSRFAPLLCMRNRTEDGDRRQFEYRVWNIKWVIFGINMEWSILVICNGWGIVIFIIFRWRLYQTGSTLFYSSTPKAATQTANRFSCSAILNSSFAMKTSQRHTSISLICSTSHPKLRAWNSLKISSSPTLSSGSSFAEGMAPSLGF